MRKITTPLMVLASGLLALSLSACGDTGANDNDELAPLDSGTVEEDTAVDTGESGEPYTN